MNGKELHGHLSELFLDLKSEKITPAKAIAVAKLANVMIQNALLHIHVARMTGQSLKDSMVGGYVK